MLLLFMMSIIYLSLMPKSICQFINEQKNQVFIMSKWQIQSHWKIEKISLSVYIRCFSQESREWNLGEPVRKWLSRHGYKWTILNRALWLSRIKTLPVSVFAPFPISLFHISGLALWLQPKDPFRPAISNPMHIKIPSNTYHINSFSFLRYRLRHGMKKIKAYDIGLRYMHVMLCKRLHSERHEPPHA